MMSDVFFWSPMDVRLMSPAAAMTTVVVEGAPQTLATPPPPHVWGEVHVPQESVPPQPFETEPQFLPSSAHVLGTHVVGQLMQTPLSQPPHPLSAHAVACSVLQVGGRASSAVMMSLGG